MTHLHCIKEPVVKDNRFLPTIQGREWRWAIVWSLVILAITSLPYLYGALITTPELHFGGFLIGVEDGNSYLAKMRLGAMGNWKFHLFYTSEPHEGAYLLLFHLLLGKLAVWSGLTLIQMYHLARLVCGLILMLTVYCFAAFFTQVRSVRRLVFWLVGTGSGLGWLVLWLGLPDGLGLPLDFYSPEAFAFHLLFGLPHLSLTMALLLWAILFILLAWERQQWRYTWLAGFALLGMTFLAAFYIIVAAAVIGVTWLLRIWTSQWESNSATRPGSSNVNLSGDVEMVVPKHAPKSIFIQGWWREAWQATLAFGIAAPVPLYNAYVFSTNPIFKIWASQNRILSPMPVHYLLAFGVLAIPAVIGAWREWQSGSQRTLLLIGWCVVIPFLLYIPFNLQRRMALGFQVALSVLAGVGLWQIWISRIRPAREGLPEAGETMRGWRFISIGLVALLSLSNLMILIGAGLTISARAIPIFQPDTQIEAADWLGANATADQVVLAAYENGNYLPTRMSARVFLGHGPETAYSDMKRTLVTQFFASDNDDFRRQLLQDYNITFLYYGPAEQALGGFAPGDAFYLRGIYDNGTVQIYQVTDVIEP